jgi:hypothetical protein
MSGNKARRRALETNDAIRVNAPVPLIVDKTVLITPEMAREMLKKNQRNRPINWKKVEEYADIMKAGKWVLHAQGIVLDAHGNILTGQKRLWAVVYSDVSVYFRVSTGNPESSARLLDRGTPQTARDLASRDTERKHSPTESSIARAIAASIGQSRPSVDLLAELMATYSERNAVSLRATTGTKKTRAVLMILASIAVSARNVEEQNMLLLKTEKLTDELKLALLPETAERCWGKGAAFALAMAQASKIVTGRM